MDVPQQRRGIDVIALLQTVLNRVGWVASGRNKAIDETTKPTAAAS